MKFAYKNEKKNLQFHLELYIDSQFLNWFDFSNRQKTYPKRFCVLIEKTIKKKT